MQTGQWITELPAAITVADADGKIIEMNARSISTFTKNGGAALIGQDVRDCHPATARETLDRLYADKQPNHYLIVKNGQRKIIHQLPWYEAGHFAGFVEISIPIPDELPCFERT